MSRMIAPAARASVLQPVFVPPSSVHSVPLRHTPVTGVSSKIAASSTNSPVNPTKSTAAEVTVAARSTPLVSGRGRRGRRMRNSKKTVPASNMAAAKFTHRTRTCETGGPIRPVPAAPPAGSRSPTPKRRNPLVV